MSGTENVLKYITTEGKRVGKATALEYLQKNTGVFNQSGMISEEEVSAMKERAQRNSGNIWHGFVSFNKQDSAKINTPEKCIRLVKNVFPSFLQEAHLNTKNIDLMCALHLDRPHHLHIHFVFWEKEAKIKKSDGTLQYRPKGRISQRAIDNMFIRMELFVDEQKETLYKSRDKAMKLLRGVTAVKTAMQSTDEIKKEIIALAKDLPKTGRISYGSKEMESFKGRVDNIVKLMLDYDGKARTANKQFYTALEEKQKAIEKICGVELDESHLDIIKKIEEDYRRRQGNLVLNLAKFVKPEYYERKQGKKYKANDDKLKRRLIIAERNVNRRMKKFLKSFGSDMREVFERDFSHRLQEIEEEIKRKRAKKNGESQETKKDGEVKD